MIFAVAALTACPALGQTTENASTAAITQPAPGSVLSERETFTWEDIGAEAYQLTLGTHPGSQDVAVPPAVRTNQVTVDIEPNGHPIYATLSALVDGEWRSTEASFVAPGDMLSLPECAATTSLWVLDVGEEIDGTPWIVPFDDPSKGPSHRFTAAASSHDGAPWQQADVGCGNGNYWSRGRWDLTQVETISFSFKDLNPTLVREDGTSALNHYVLLYDRNFRYHQWWLDNPDDKAPYAFRPGEWTDITVTLSDDPSTYFIEGYNFSEPFDWSEIIFFEVGIFGPAVRPSDEIVWEIGPVSLN